MRRAPLPSFGSCPADQLPHRITLPVLMLGLAALLSLTSALGLRNHQGLTDAVGPSGLSLARPRPRQVDSTLLDRVGNPFTLTVLVFSVGLVLAAFTIPACVTSCCRGHVLA